MCIVNLQELHFFAADGQVQLLPNFCLATLNKTWGYHTGFELFEHEIKIKIANMLIMTK